MKQTAVEWFNQQLVDRQNGNGDSRSRDEILEQAKEMEKEQKIEFANDYGFHRFCGYDYENAEEYYNQTHKQQKP